MPHRIYHSALLTILATHIHPRLPPYTIGSIIGQRRMSIRGNGRAVGPLGRGSENEIKKMIDESGICRAESRICRVEINSFRFSGVDLFPFDGVAREVGR